MLFPKPKLKLIDQNIWYESLECVNLKLYQIDINFIIYEIIISKSTDSYLTITRI